MRQMKRLLLPLIDRIGQFFKIDARYFAKNVSIMLASHLVAILKGLVTGYLVTRMFPREMYGEFKFITNIVGIVSVIAVSGLVPVLSRTFARKEHDAPIQFTLVWYTLLSAIGSAILLLSIPFLGNWHREELWPLFVIAALLFTPNNVGTTFFGAYVTGTGKFDMALRASVLGSILQIITVLTMLFIYPSSAILMALTTGIPVVIYLWMLRGLLRDFPSRERSWKMLTSSIHFTIADLPISLSWYLDGILISAFFGVNQLAIFSVALFIPENIKLLLKEMTPITFAKQAHGTDSHEKRKHLAKAVWIGTGIFFSGALLYSLLTPWLVPLFFPQYPSAQVILLTNVAAFTLITMPSGLFTQHLEARGNIVSVRNVQWVASIVFVIALFVLIPIYGPLGAIIARGLFRLSIGGQSYFAMMRAEE